MKNVPLIIATAVASAVAMATAIGQPLRAQEMQPPVAQEKITPLLRAPLNGAEGKEVNIVHISVPPGFVTPKHVHPGQLFVYVVKGTVTIDVDGKAPIKLGPGDVVEEPSGKSMVGKNPSATHPAELVVFQIGDTGKPLTVEVE